MRIIPVLDLKGGVAVHARRGDRANYHPVESLLAPGTADPIALAEAFRRAGYTEIYIADLDAIGGTGDHLALVGRMATATGLAVLLDAGLQRAAAAEALLAAGAAVVIAGSETLAGWSELSQLIAAHGPERVIFSLDLRGGKVVTADPQMAAAPEQLLAAAAACGVRTALLLELAAVGSEGGPPLALARRLRAAAPGVQLLVGGGVRDQADLDSLAEAGVAGALVATALHNGRLSKRYP